VDAAEQNEERRANAPRKQNAARLKEKKHCGK